MSNTPARTRPVFWLLLFAIAGDVSSPGLFPRFLGDGLLAGLLSGIIFIVALHLFRVAGQTSGTQQIL